MPNPSQIPRTFAKILPVRSSLKASTVSPLLQGTLVDGEALREIIVESFRGFQLILNQFGTNLYSHKFCVDTTNPAMEKLSL